MIDLGVKVISVAQVIIIIGGPLITLSAVVNQSCSVLVLFAPGSGANDGPC